MPAEDFVAEPLEGDQGNGVAGARVVIRGEQVLAKKPTDRLVSEPRQPSDSVKDGTGWEAVSVDGAQPPSDDTEGGRWSRSGPGG